jgi:H+-translocating NAD(P) transhydrogenase subunit alpha
MDIQTLSQQSLRVLGASQELMQEAKQMSNMAKILVQQASHSMADPFMICLMVFMLACFIGYYVVWKVTPSLHSPLMAVTNAISSVIVVGAIIAAGAGNKSDVSNFFGFLGVLLASINIFGGFMITKRMLDMFVKNK